MKVRVSEKRPWIVHAIAQCHGCSWRAEWYITAAEKGRAHAKKTGHRVDVETGYCQIYNG